MKAFLTGIGLMSDLFIVGDMEKYQNYFRYAVYLY